MQDSISVSGQVPVNVKRTREREGRVCLMLYGFGLCVVVAFGENRAAAEQKTLLNLVDLCLSETSC
jgi:hypothetical protein